MMMDSEGSEQGGVPAFEPLAAVGLLLIGAAASLCGGWCALSLHEGDMSWDAMFRRHVDIRVGTGMEQHRFHPKLAPM